MPREPLDPNRIFRECDARDLFGFGNTQLKEKIKNGDVPAPHLLSSPPSRARGWWGWEINDWQKKVETQQQQWAADAKNFYVPTPPNNKKPMKPPVKKVKLKRPTCLG
jgi:hypothetical protein